jgi:hypothetical protein
MVNGLEQEIKCEQLRKSARKNVKFGNLLATLANDFNRSAGQDSCVFGGQVGGEKFTPELGAAGHRCAGLARAPADRAGSQAMKSKHTKSSAALRPLRATLRS